MLVSQFMTDSVFSLRPQDDLVTARRLMWDEDIRHVPIVDEDGDLVGLVTHRDVIRIADKTRYELTLSAHNEAMREVRLADFMTEDVATVESDVEVRKAAQIMLEGKYGCLPVVMGTRLVGIITESDFVRLAAKG